MRNGFKRRNNFIMLLHLHFRMNLLCSQPYLHKFFQSAEQRSAPLSAHGKKNRMNAIDKLLMRFQASRAARISKFNEDLAPVLAASPAFYQSPFFEAINSANHGRRINSQLPSNAADGAGFSDSLGMVNQAQDDKLGRAKPVLVRMFETYPHHFAQVREGSSKSFYLLVYCWLFRLVIDRF